MNLRNFSKLTSTFAKTPRMPVLFVGHGSPANALEDNEFTRDWVKTAQNLPTPTAVLCISAHWFVDGTFVHTAAKPQTIHDFYGFPPELYALHYHCPGAPEVAAEVQKIISSTSVAADSDWGLDHGAWVVLRHLFPEANVPTFQMSIDYTKSAEFHFALGAELQKLRERGVLIIGSGNIVHNLGLITFEEVSKPYDWALEFDDASKKLISSGDFDQLINYKTLGSAAHHAIPTPEHYFPMLYTLGLKQPDEEVKFFAEGIAHKSISMRSFIIQ